MDGTFKGLKDLLILLGIVGGLLFFWLFPLKLISWLAHWLGASASCPAALSWLVHNPLRRWYMRPVLGRVGIQPGECVLELGPGPGAFTVDAARRAGSEGRLIAVDIQPKMIARVERRIQEAGLTNVETHVADAYNLPLESESVERAFPVTVLPKIPDQNRALAELRRVIKPGGISPSPRSLWTHTIHSRRRRSAGSRRRDSSWCGGLATSGSTRPISGGRCRS